MPCITAPVCVLGCPHPTFRAIMASLTAAPSASTSTGARTSGSVARPKPQHSACTHKSFGLAPVGPSRPPLTGRCMLDASHGVQPSPSSPQHLMHASPRPHRHDVDKTCCCCLPACMHCPPALCKNQHHALPCHCPTPCVAVKRSSKQPLLFSRPKFPFLSTAI